MIRWEREKKNTHPQPPTGMLSFDQETIGNVLNPRICNEKIDFGWNT
jgi:hypothetical protein